jgi:hypothetical protein
VHQREYNPKPGRFRDPYGRVEPPLADIEVDRDYFLDPADGKRVKLVVQQGEECLFDNTTEFPRTWSAPEQMHEMSTLNSLATFSETNFVAYMGGVLCFRTLSELCRSNQP